MVRRLAHEDSSLLKFSFQILMFLKSGQASRTIFSALSGKLCLPPLVLAPPSEHPNFVGGLWVPPRHAVSFELPRWTSLAITVVAPSPPLLVAAESG